VSSRSKSRLDRIEAELAPKEGGTVALFIGSPAEVEEQRRAWMKAHRGREPRESLIIEP